MSHKVLMLLSNPFRPDPRVYKEARSLIKAGYSVKIFAWDRDGTFPPKETIDGIEVRRFSIPSTYGSMAMAVGLFRFWLKVVRAARKEEFDIIHCHDFDTLPAGLLIARLTGKKVIYDAHEHYASMIHFDVPSIVATVVDRFEPFLLKKVEGVIAVNERVGQMIAREYTVITNAKTLQTIESQKIERCRMEIAKDGTFTITYIGVLEPMRFLLEACEAVRRMDGVRLVIGGYGRLEDDIRKMADDRRIIFLGRVPFEDVLPYTAASDAVLCVFDPSNPNNVVGTPNKLFEGMMAGRPVLTTRGTYSGDITERTGCGIAIDYSIPSFIQAVERLKGDRKLAREMGEKGRAAAETEYNWGVMEKRLLSLYSDVLSR